MRASGVVTAIGRGGTVDVFAQGGILPGLEYPGWYAPALGDSVIVDWLNQQPYVSQAFTGTGVFAASSYTSGQSYSSPHTGRSTALPAINKGGAIPFLAARSAVWTSMGVEVTGAAGAGGLCRLGVYVDNGAGYPGALLATPGVVPTTAGGSQTVSFPSRLTLAPGLYWLGFQIEVSSSTLRSVTGSVAGLLGLRSAPGASVWDGFYGDGSGWSAGSMPGTFPTGVPQVSNLPLVLLTAA